MTAIGLGMFIVAWFLLRFIGSDYYDLDTYNWADWIGLALFFPSVILMLFGVLEFLWNAMP